MRHSAGGVRALWLGHHSFASPFALHLIRADQIDFRANQTERECGGLLNRSDQTKVTSRRATL